MNREKYEALQKENFETADYYGLEHTMMQTQEEAAELIQAISKYYRAVVHGMPAGISAGEARKLILEEAADVQIMLDQLRHLFNFFGPEYDDRVSYKVHRATERRRQYG